MDIEIRALTPADRAHWEPLWRGYLAFYKTSVPDETTALSFARLTGKNAAMRGWLAFQGEAAVGMVNAIDHPSTWTGGDYCYLQDLFVQPGLRGGGVGRRLIETVVESARGRGCSRVYWLTHETNLDAMQLYDRVADRSGFIQYRKML